MTFPRINHKIIKEVFGESVRVVECLSYPHIKLPEQMKRENKEIINRIEVILNFHLFFNLNPLTKLQAKFQASLKSTTSNTKITTSTTSTLKSAGIKNAPQLSVTHEVIAPLYTLNHHHLPYYHDLIYSHRVGLKRFKREFKMCLTSFRN